jgi:hypothetical protein
MTDEPEDGEGDEGPAYEVEGFSDSEYVEVEGAQIIAPKGWGWFADHFAAAAVRVKMAKGGSIEVLVQSADAETWHWQAADKAPAAVTAIKPK